MKKIKDIIDCDYDIDIYGITDDSRNVEEGFLFVATKGFNVDHYDYIEDAIEKGCSCVICDRDIEFSIPYIKVTNIDDVFLKCCLKFYDLNLDDYKFIGITGTDGKTTTTTLVKKILSDAAVIGTNGLSVADIEIKTENTTPCVSELYRDLKYIKDNNCSNVVMEVSSEALLHDRVKDLRYDIVGFTNITGDHLNVHGTFQNYIDCKLKLLNLLKENGKVVVNGDDSILRKIDCQNMSTFGFDKCNDFVISDVKYLDNYTEIKVVHNSEVYILKNLFKGKYNVYNVVMAFVIGFLSGIDSDILIERLSSVECIAGRGEELDFGQKYKIILDYAHTVNGIKNIVETYHDKRLIVVTGCAGGREKSKRPVIGNMIMDNSSLAIFTMDDPRSEDVSKIIDEMADGRSDCVKIINRDEAIYYALDNAREGDIVLILGKGRDNYMAILDKKIEYSDYSVIKKYFSNR